jgi:hypothetical protein
VVGSSSRTVRSTAPRPRIPNSCGTGLFSHGTPPATTGASPSYANRSRWPSGSAKAMEERPSRSSTPPCRTPCFSRGPAYQSSASRPRTLNSVVDTSPVPVWFGTLLNCGPSKNVTSIPFLKY